MPVGNEVIERASIINMSKLVRPLNTPLGNVVKLRSAQPRYVTLPRSLNNPAGTEVSSVPRLKSVSPVSPPKSPTFTEFLSTKCMLVIAARCASVTSAAEFTPVSSTISSRTAGVRALTPVTPPYSVNASGSSWDLTRV